MFGDAIVYRDLALEDGFMTACALIPSIPLVQTSLLWHQPEDLRFRNYIKIPLKLSKTT